MVSKAESEAKESHRPIRERVVSGKLTSRAITRES